MTKQAFLREQILHLFSGRLLQQKGLLIALVGLLWALTGVSGWAQAPGDLPWRQINGPFGGNIDDLTLHEQTGHLFAGTPGGLFRSTDNGASWEVTSLDDRVRTVLVDSKGTLFANVQNDRLFRSVDAGLTWQPVETGIAQGYIYLALDSFDRLWVSASYWDAEAEETHYVVLRSADGGATWEPVALPDKVLVWTVLVFPGTLHLIAGDVNGRVFLSTDDGASWVPSNTGLPEHAWGAGTLVLDGRTGGLYLGFVSDRLYRSMDGGRTWESLGFPHDCVFDVVIDRDGNIYAGTPEHGVYRSVDEGATWEEAYSGLPTIQLGEPEPYVLTVNALAFSVEGHLFAGTNGGGIYQSRNQAVAWNPVNSGLIATRIRSLSVAPDGDLLAGLTVGQISRSADGGATWTEVTLPTFTVNDILADEEGRLFVAADHWGRPVLRSADDGATWEILVLDTEQGGSNDLAFDDAGHLYAATHLGLYRSTDHGETWERLLRGANEDQEVLAVAFGPGGEIYAASFQGVYRSDDDGQTWTKSTLTENGTVWAVAVTGEGHIFAGTGRAVYRSTDKGATWEVVQQWENRVAVRALLVDPNGDVYAGTSFGGLLRSTDGGETWHRTGLGDLNVASLAVNSVTGSLYAGTITSGVFEAKLFTGTSVEWRGGPVPETAVLLHNYPNPFRGTTVIEFDVAEAGPVNLAVYDGLGRKVAALIDEPMQPGSYRVPFVAEGLPSGLYAYRLETQAQTITQTMVHVR